MVLSSVRFQARLAKKAEKHLDRQAKNIQAAKNRTLAVQYRIQQRITQLETQKAEVYLSYDRGEISQSEYRTRCKKIDNSITGQKRRLDALEQTNDSGPPNMEFDSYGQIDTLKSLSNLRTLDRSMVEKLIRYIQVYGGNRIEITWNFSESFIQLLTENEGTVMRDDH